MNRFVRDFLIPLLIFYLLVYTGFDQEINVLDEGTWLDIYKQLSLGKKLYVQIYTPYGPILIYTQYLLMKILGSSLLSQRLIFLGFNFLGFMIFHFLAKLAIKKYNFVVLADIYFLLLSSVNLNLHYPFIFRQGISLLPFIFLILYQKRNNILYLFLSGIGVIFAFLVTPEAGGFSFLAIFTYLILNRYPWKKFLFSCLITTLLWISYLVSDGILISYLRNNFSAISVYRLPWSNYLVMILSFLIYLFTFFNSKKDFPSALSFLGIVYFIFAIRRRDIWHIYYSLFPAIILTFYNLKTEKKFIQMLFSIFFLLWSGILIPKIMAKLKFHRQAKKIYVMANNPCIKVKIPFVQNEYLTKLNNWIKTNIPEKKVLFFPHQAAFYFIFDKMNPTPYQNIFMAFSKEKQKRVIEDLEKEKVNWIIVTTTHWSFDGIEYHKLLPYLWQYIIENFEIVHRIGSTFFLKRKK